MNLCDVRKIIGLFDSLLPSHVQNSRNLIPFVSFLGTSPTHCGRHISMPPNSNLSNIMQLNIFFSNRKLVGLFIMILGPTCIVNAVWAFALASVVPGQLDAARSAEGEQPLLLAAGWD